MKTPEGAKEIKEIKEANRKRENASNEETSEAGCTAVTCLVTQNEIYVANAGDSRCFLGIGTNAEDMSVDHKPDLPQ